MRFAASTHLAAVLFLGVVCALFFHNVFLKPGELMVSPVSDVIGQFGYWEGFLREEFRRTGWIPQYNPYTLCGHPVTGNIQYLEYYPFRIASYLFDADWAAGFHFFLHAWILAIGSYFLARRCGLAVSGSLLTAVAASLNLRCLSFVYAGFSLLLPSVSFIPWVWLGFWIMLRGQYGRGILVSGIALGFCFLGGWSQMVLLNGLCLGILGLGSFILDRDFGHLLRTFGHVAGSAVVAIGVSAFKLFPSVALSSLTTRSESLSFDMASQYSLPLKHLVGFLVPDFYGSPTLGTYRGDPNFWEMGCYFTAGCLVLGLIGMVHAPRRERYLLGILVIFCLGFSLGKVSPIYSLCWRFLPGLGHFRAPARILFFLGQALALLSGHGFTWLAKESSSKMRGLWAGGIFLFLWLPLVVIGLRFNSIAIQASGQVLFSSNQQPMAMEEVIRSSGKACLRSCIWFGSALGLVLLAGKARRCSMVSGGAAIGLVIADAFVCSMPFLETLPKETVYPGSPVAAWLGEQQGLFRVLDLTEGAQALPDGISWRYGLQKIGGYDPTTMRITSRSVCLLEGKPWLHEPFWIVKADRVANRIMLDLLNVRYVATSTPSSLEGLVLRERFEEVPTFVQFAGGHVLPRVYVYENTQWLPRAWWVEDVLEVHDEEGWFLLEQQAFSPDKTLLLHRDEPLKGKFRAERGERRHQQEEKESAFEACSMEVVLMDHGAGRLKCFVSTKRPGWVVVSEMALPGWHATLDGNPIPLRNVNGWMMAVFCPVGEHEIVWVYRAPAFRLGMAVTGCTIVLLIWIVLLHRKERSIGDSRTG